MKTAILKNLLSIAVFLVIAVQESPASPGLPLWGVALDGNPLTRERLDKVEAQTGFPFQIVVFFLQWTSNLHQDNFPIESLAAIRERGSIPCITWEPMFYENGHAVTINWQRIVNGDYDPYLTTFARQAREFGNPLIIRLAHEMNLNHYHWGTTSDEYNKESPEIYKRIYRHVVDLFKKEGANNVLWAFSPNAESVPAPDTDKKNSWNRVENYYPGHTYVDILGMDGYNWGPARTLEKDGWQSRWQRFDELFGMLYRELRNLAPSKPIIVFETASVAVGGDKKKWLEEALSISSTWNLSGLVWFEVDKEFDWRLASGIASDYLPVLSTLTSTDQSGFWRVTKQP